MIYIYRVFIALLIIVLSGCSLDKVQSSSTNVEKHSDSQYIEANVIRVKDGDTFVTKVNGKEETVRLILVDTPETKHPHKPVQPFGEEASNFTKETLTNETVNLEIGVQERDKYGRLLAYVYLKDGTMFNKLLLSKGLARVAVFPPNTKYLEEFKNVSENAKSKGEGIWSIENYVTEQGFNTN